MIQVTKDPRADLDYTIDWSVWLGDDDLIQASTWTVDSTSGITAHDQAITGGTACTVWLRGGIAGLKHYLVTNQITTAGGRVDERSMQVMVQAR